MGARFFRPKRLLTLALLAVSLGVAAWWVVHVPYDPLAIYRPIPASATLVGRHLRLPERWNDLLANPLALALMRTMGVRTEDAAALMADEESQAWFEKLAGREGTLAYLPGRFGRAPAWMAVSHLGGESQKLRWQLSLFRVPGFERMESFPGRSVWQVDSRDLEPGQHLAIAFGEGVILACLSEDPLAIEEALAAYDGRRPRLMEREPSFARFAEGDDRKVPDRLWIRDESELAAIQAPGIVVDIPVLRGDAISLQAATEGVEWVAEDQAASLGTGDLARLLGEAPCAAAVIKQVQLQELLKQPGWQSDVHHALRMIADVATEDLVVVLMDGDMGGRLTVGLMKLMGAGMRVSTLMLATPVPDKTAAVAAIQRVLDASNARYRAAFVLKPMVLPATTIYVLESAGGNEWVDELPLAERPAYAVLDGWLLAASNLGVLQKLAQLPARTGGGSWAKKVDATKAVSAWMDLARSGQEARNAVATWSMVQRAQGFLNGGNSGEILSQLEEAKTWIHAFEPFGQATAKISRRDGQSVLSLDLGLSGASGLDRMPAP